MLTVNIHEAKSQLSNLIRMAVDGQLFIIAKLGKLMVIVEAHETPVAVPKRKMVSWKGGIRCLTISMRYRSAGLSDISIHE